MKCRVGVEGGEREREGERETEEQRDRGCLCEVSSLKAASCTGGHTHRSPLLEGVKGWRGGLAMLGTGRQQTPGYQFLPVDRAAEEVSGRSIGVDTQKYFPPSGSGGQVALAQPRIPGPQRVACGWQPL